MKNFNYVGDACLIQSPSNLFYFTGYDNADAMLLMRKGEHFYFTDSRYFEEITEVNPQLKIENINSLNAFIREKNIKSLSVEKSLPVNIYFFLREQGVTEFLMADNEISALRAVKSESELTKIERAQQITDLAFHKILSQIHEGMTEIELASLLEGSMYALGATGLSFPSIVAFGKNTAKPHAHRSQIKLEKGMPITLDFGAKYLHYCSDMTRTVFFGNPKSAVLDTYKLVLEAQTLALDTIHAGMTGTDCDNIARQFFASKGLDEYFIHSLGHGLGVDIHEPPNFSQKCGLSIQQGAVMSVEPGLYFENEYGIRIEDIIYFGKNGVSNLTKSDKNIIIL